MWLTDEVADAREEAGVKVRVELGPKEAAAGQCILAICTSTPGEVAAKTMMQVRDHARCHLLAALVKPGQRDRYAVTSPDAVTVLRR